MGQCCSSNENNGSRASTTGYPVKKRSCTDVPCCILFVLFIIGFAIVALWSFAMGDYRRVVYPTNSKGQICGKDVPGKPYLYFFDLAKCIQRAPIAMFLGCPTTQVCVQSCPNYYWSWKVPYSKDYPHPSRELMVCLDGKNATAPEFLSMSIEELVMNHKCAPYTYNAEPVFGRCMPHQPRRLFSNGTGRVYDRLGEEIVLADSESKTITGVSILRGGNVAVKMTNAFEKIMSDLTKSWPTIVVCLVITAVLSFVWVVILRCCAGGIVWTSLIIFLLLLGTCWIFAAPIDLFSTDIECRKWKAVTNATGYSFYRWHQLRSIPEELPSEFLIDFTWFLRSSTTWLVFGIISAVVLVLMTLIFFCLLSRIRIAIAIIQQTSKALVRLNGVLIWPLFPLILELLIVTLTLFVAISLRTISDPVGVSEDQDSVMNTKKRLQDFFQLIPCDPKADTSAGEACRFIYYGNQKYAIFLQLFNIFMFFWLVNFVRALTEMTMAGTFAHYYYSRHDPKTMPHCPLMHSFSRSLYYHTGSLAFGSLLLALLQWVRVVFEYVSSKLKGFDNAFSQALLRCCCCCCWCLEKFLCFLNRNAFIMIAIRGESFCTGAKTAFTLLLKNVIRVIVINKITEFLLIIGKLIIAFIGSVLAYLYLDGYVFSGTPLAQFSPSIHYVFIPVLIVCFGSYLIASLFSSVYSIGVDTMFLCFLEDIETNDGSVERPYYMGKELLEILGKKNKLDPLKGIEMHTV